MPRVRSTIIALNDFIVVSISHTAERKHTAIYSHSSPIRPASFHACNIPPAVHPGIIDLYRVLHDIS